VGFLFQYNKDTAVEVYNNDSPSVIPAGITVEQTSDGRAARDVPVFYVGVHEQAGPRRRCAPTQCYSNQNALGCAARGLHRMADQVDNLRRSIERARDGA
jgi:hypothetical protein